MAGPLPIRTGYWPGNRKQRTSWQEDCCARARKAPKVIYVPATSEEFCGNITAPIFSGGIDGHREKTNHSYRGSKTAKKKGAIW